MIPLKRLAGRNGVTILSLFPFSKKRLLGGLAITCLKPSAFC